MRVFSQKSFACLYGRKLGFHKKSPKLNPVSSWDIWRDIEHGQGCRRWRRSTTRATNMALVVATNFPVKQAAAHLGPSLAQRMEKHRTSNRFCIVAHFVNYTSFSSAHHPNALLGYSVESSALHYFIEHELSYLSEPSRPTYSLTITSILLLRKLLHLPLCRLCVM